MQEPKSENWEMLGNNQVEGTLYSHPQQYPEKTKNQKTSGNITKWNNKNARTLTILSLYPIFHFRNAKMRPTIKIYMEILEEVNTDDERINCTDYLIKECKTITDQFKADADELNNAKRYWKDKGAKEKENGRNEVANAIYRLIVMFESITDYLTEMNRWWKKERIIIPLLGNFYNGPENSAFLASVIGLKDAEERKQNQTRLGLIELELATQYINIAAGRYKTPRETLISHTKHTETSETKPPTINKNKFYTTEEVTLILGLYTKKLHLDNLLTKHAQDRTKTTNVKRQHFYFQGKWQRKPIQAPLWTHSFLQYAYQEPNGNLLIDCEPLKTNLNIPQKGHIFSEKMDSQEENTVIEIWGATFHEELKDGYNNHHTESTNKRISKLSRKYKLTIKNDKKMELKHKQITNIATNGGKAMKILKNNPGNNSEENCEGNIKLRLRKYSLEPNSRKLNNDGHNK